MTIVRNLYNKDQIFQRPPMREVQFLLLTSIDTYHLVTGTLFVYQKLQAVD